MPSLRDWAVPTTAPDEAGGSGAAAAQEGVTLAPSGGAGFAEEGGWPGGYLPAEAEAGWADAGGAEDEDEEEDMADGAAGLAEPEDAGGPTLAPRMGTSFDRVGGEEEDEACGSAAHAEGRAGPPGDARGSAGGAVRNKGARAVAVPGVHVRGEPRGGAALRAVRHAEGLARVAAAARAAGGDPARGPTRVPGRKPGPRARLAPGDSSGDAPRCGAAATEGPAGFHGAGAGASDAPTSGAAAGAAPAAAEVQGAELPLGSAAGAEPLHAGTAARGAYAAAGSQAAEPDWEPADGSASGGWRCRRCGEVVDSGARSGEGSGSGPGSEGAQARGAHDDWHFAVEMQRRESGPGHEPGPKGLGPVASGVGERGGGGMGRGVEPGGRAAGGRKRKASGTSKPVRDRSRLSRGTMDAFLLRANSKGS